MTDPAPPRPHRSDGSEPILAHGLIYFRPAERDDLPLFVRWLSDARTTRTLAVVSPLSQPLEERWFEQMLEHHGRDRWHFVICRLADDRPVGVIDLHEIDTTNGSAGLGILIGTPDDTGQGYGSDALRAILAFGFGELRLERIWLEVYAINEGARRVYERVGFVHEGTLRRALFRGGSYHDVHRMAILRLEWSAAGGS
ncbi:MAG TPA: GNAT family protein [Candidatus Limnocylindrales bacterium]|nr:GNAT family protein [Candidatus Limnocylindrales bacterium]